MSRLDRARIILAFLGTGALPFTVRGETPAQPKTVTLVVAFDESKAEPQVVAALQSELAEIWRSESVKLDWRPIESIHPGDSFEDLVVVHFKGDCRVRPDEWLASHAFLIDERGPQSPGPFAYSSTVDGHVQPFSSVLCNRVERSVESAMQVDQRRFAESLFGRALGRVLSHELYHILNQTRQHQHQGLAKASLTGEQLIAPHFRFAEE
ncbi:MAG TPA: hypothetical protein VGL53_30515 [Bryobacteraceae bacterium]|jgi:hypothetical protein